MKRDDGPFPFLFGFGGRGWAIACAASQPFVVAGRGELGDAAREEFDAECLVLAMRSPDTSVTILTCDVNEAGGVAGVVLNALSRSGQPRGWVVAVVDAPGEPLTCEALRGVTDLRSACHAVVLATADPTDPDGGAVAAVRALIGMCGHRGWVAIHPEDVMLALKGSSLIRVGSAAGGRGDLVALAELAALRAAVDRAGEDGGVLVHLEASDEAGIWTDVVRAVGAVTERMPANPDEVWAYTVSARGECRITVLLAPHDACDGSEVTEKRL